MGFFPIDLGTFVLNIFCEMIFDLDMHNFFVLFSLNEGISIWRNLKFKYAFTLLMVYFNTYRMHYKQN